MRFPKLNWREWLVSTLDLPVKIEYIPLEADRVLVTEGYTGFRDNPDTVQEAIRDLISTPCTYRNAFCSKRHLACMARWLVARGWTSPEEMSRTPLTLRAIEKLNSIQEQS